MTETAPIQIAFVCVQNAGRSQMAFAFTQRERSVRDLERDVELVTGGTRPADHVHSKVIDAMAAIGIDLSDRTSREVTFEALQASHYVITMGCSADGGSADHVCPTSWVGESRDWELDDPDGLPADAVAEIRDDIEAHVRELFEELHQRIA